MTESAQVVHDGQWLVEQWNQTQRPYPSELCVHQLFEARAAAAPDATALVCDDGVVTYGQLNRRANQLARVLQAGGAGPGAFVAVCLEHCADAVVGLLGIVKSGAAYVPLEPGWPAERQCHILQSLQVGAVVTQVAQHRRLSDLRWELPAMDQIVCLDALGAEVGREPLDEDAARELWDQVALEATDIVSRAGFRRTDGSSPFTLDEVLQYQQHVLALARPLVHPGSHVLELGCGSGLVMRPLAAAVRTYIGLDPSPQTQRANQEWAATTGAGTTLVTGFAHDAIALAPGPFDLVIAASTVQFFPGPAYLRDVLRQVASSCAPGGHILLADLIDPDLFQQRFGPAESRAKRERELHVHPSQLIELAGGLDQVVDVEVCPRHGFENELGCRYDAVLTVGPASQTLAGRPSRLRVLTSDALDRQNGDDLPLAAQPDDLAYVIFTSGSTGDPKGVMVQHRPVVNLIDWVNTTFSVGPDDRLLLVTSFCFDLSVYDVFGILAAGGSIRVVSDATLAEPRRLLSVLCTDGITFWDSAPAALHQLMPFADRERPAFPLDDLRLVFLSGDWIPLRLPDQVRSHFLGATVVGLGGATEATIWSNFFVIGNVDESWASVPYGRPIQNARYYVLDTDLAQCPIGAPGDLYIGGECLAAGYAGDPELSARKFLPDPFGSTPGATMYRTGDRARYRPDGNMEFLGRLDHQVKIRGFRVELGEIEAALARHPAVDVGVVVAQPGLAGDLQLDAYVLPVRPGAAGGDVDERGPSHLEPRDHELRAHLGALLPEYMIPRSFTILAELPVSPTGKVDRKALPKPAPSVRHGDAGDNPDALEARILAVWSDVLKVPDIGLDDNFFQLGGHSLAAARVVAHLSHSESVTLPLRAVFDHPTVRALGAAVRGRTDASPGWRQMEVLADRSSAQLSDLQSQMWEMETDLPPATWNETFHHRLPDRFDADALERSLSHLVGRHEGLRTEFVADQEGRMVQRVLADATLASPAIDLSHLSVEERDDELWRIMAADNEIAFAADEAPLLRSTVVTFGPDRTELVVTFDHLIVDRTSVDILFTDLDDIYAALLEGKTPSLPPLPFQYVDFAAWEHARIINEEQVRRIGYWRDHLDGMPLDLDLPYDRVPERPGPETSFVAFGLPAEVFRSLHRLAAVSQSSLFVLALAAVNTLLARRCGKDDIVVGTQLSGRAQPEIQHVVGLFTGPALLRTDLSGDPTLETLVRRIRQGLQDLLDRQPFPYTTVLASLFPEVARREIPWWRAIDAVDVEFFYTDPTRWSPGVSVVVRPPANRYPTADDRAEFSQPLEFHWFSDGEQMWGKVTYRVALFDQSTIESMVNELQELLAGAAANWQARLSRPASAGSSGVTTWM